MARPKKLAGTVVRETVQLDEDLAGRLQDAVQLADLPKAEVLREALRRGMNAYMDELCERRPEVLKQRIRDIRDNEIAWKLYLRNRDFKKPSVPLDTAPNTIILVQRACAAYHELSELGIIYEPSALTGEDKWQKLVAESNDARRKRHLLALDEMRKKGYLDIHQNYDGELCLTFDEVIHRDLDWVRPAKKGLLSLIRSGHLRTGALTPGKRQEVAWTGKPF